MARRRYCIHIVRSIWHHVQSLLDTGSLGSAFDRVDSRSAGSKPQHPSTEEHSKQFQNVALSDATHSGQATDRKDLHIRAIRITTSVGHFQIDILNPEATERYVSVISHRNIARQISHLCEHTSLYPILSRKFNQALLDTIGGFEAADYA